MHNLKCKSKMQHSNSSRGRAGCRGRDHDVATALFGADVQSTPSRTHPAPIHARVTTQWRWSILDSCRPGASACRYRVRAPRNADYSAAEPFITHRPSLHTLSPPPTHNTHPQHPPTRGLTLSDGSEAEECEPAESPFAQDDQLNRKIVLWNGNILSLKVVRLPRVQNVALFFAAFSASSNYN